MPKRAKNKVVRKQSKSKVVQKAEVVKKTEVIKKKVHKNKIIAGLLGILGVGLILSGNFGITGMTVAGEELDKTTIGSVAGVFLLLIALIVFEIKES